MSFVVRTLLQGVVLSCFVGVVCCGLAIDNGETTWGVATSFSTGTPSDPGLSSGSSSECWAPFNLVGSTALFGTDCPLSSSTCFSYADSTYNSISTSCTYSGGSQTASDLIVSRLGDNYNFRFRGNTEVDSYYYPSSEHWWAPKAVVGGGDVLCNLPQPTVTSGDCIQDINVYLNFTRVHKEYTDDRDNDGADEDYKNEHVRADDCYVKYTTASCGSVTGITFNMYTVRCVYREEKKWAVEGLMKCVGIWIIGMLLIAGGPVLIILWPAAPLFIGVTLTLAVVKMCCCAMKIGIDELDEGGGDTPEVEFEGGGQKPPVVGKKPPGPSAPPEPYAVQLSEYPPQGSPPMGYAPQYAPQYMPQPQPVIIQNTIVHNPPGPGVPAGGVPSNGGAPPGHYDAGGQSGPVRRRWIRFVRILSKIYDPLAGLLAILTAVIMLTYIPVICIAILSVLAGAFLFGVFPFFIILFGICTLVSSLNKEGCSL